MRAKSGKQRPKKMMETIRADPERYAVCTLQRDRTIELAQQKAKVKFC